MRKIEILYFQGCPNHPPAVELARSAVAELGLETEFEIVAVEVDDVDKAQAQKFLGSPSIRVDGRDIEPGADSRTAFGLSCRTYNGRGLPEKAWLSAALSAESGIAPDLADIQGLATITTVFDADATAPRLLFLFSPT